MTLYFIKREDGRWINKSYKRLADAKNLITRRARGPYSVYRNATIYQIELNDNNTTPIAKASHEIKIENYTNYNGESTPYERVRTTFDPITEKERKLNNESEEELRNI